MNARGTLFAAAMLLSYAPLAAPAPDPVQDRVQEQARLDMQGTSIIGDRELPNVLYIVPWKDAAPAGPATEPDARREETLPAHLKRDVVQRQLRHQQKNAAAGGDGGGR